LHSQATLYHTVELHPKFLGKGIVDTVVRVLESEVEGTTVEGVGCIVCVIHADVSFGLCRAGAHCAAATLGPRGQFALRAAYAARPAPPLPMPARSVTKCLPAGLMPSRAS